MPVTTKLSLALVPLAVAFVLGSAGIYSESALSARALSSLNRSDLSAEEKLEFARRLGPADRVQFGSTLSDEDRSELWSLHLTNWLNAPGALSAAQASVVSWAKTVVGEPASFRDGRLKTVCAKARAVLPGVTGELVLARLGSRPGDMFAEARSHGAFRRAIDSVGALLLRPVHASGFFKCTCPLNEPSGWCCPAGCSCVDGTGCSNYGLVQCGCFQVFDCTGYCANCGDGNQVAAKPDAR